MARLGGAPFPRPHVKAKGAGLGDGKRPPHLQPPILIFEQPPA
jgi:hypothetical protein